MKTILVRSLAILSLSILGNSVFADTPELPFNPLENAKVGQFVVYEMPSVPGMEVKTTITAVTDTDVTMSAESIMNGTSMGAQETTVKKDQGTAANATGIDADIKMKEGVTVEINGKTYTDVVTFETTVDGITAKSYFSKEVPVSGLLKVETAGTNTMQIKDFGG